MNRSVILLLTVCLVPAAALAATVTNPSFETGDNTGWTPFGSSDGVQDLAGWFHNVAAYDGDYGWGAAANGPGQNGGCYQQVTDALAGMQYIASVWINNEGPDPSARSSRIGLADGAVTNPAALSIQWSAWVNAHSAWEQIDSPPVVATGTTVTIFLEHQQSNAADWKINRFDLVELDEQVAPTPTPTFTPTATPVGLTVIIDDSLDQPAPGGWTFVQVSGSGDTASVETDRGGDGDWNMGGSDGTGASAPREAYYYRNIPAASLPEGPGAYLVDLSGWSKAWAGWWGGDNWDWLQQAAIEIWIDGALVFDGNTGQCGTADGNWDTWINHTYSGNHDINSDIEVRLRARKGDNNCDTGGLGAIFWGSRFDDILLTVAEATGPPPPAVTPSANVRDFDLYR